MNGIKILEDDPQNSTELSSIEAPHLATAPVALLRWADVVGKRNIDALLAWHKRT